MANDTAPYGTKKDGTPMKKRGPKEAKVAIGRMIPGKVSPEVDTPEKSKTRGRRPKEEIIKAENVAKAVADSLTTEAQKEIEEEEGIYDGLSERQTLIYKLSLRGLTQSAIGKILQISQPAVAKELRKIREYFQEQGRQVDENYVVGSTVSLYQEVETKAWEIYNDANSESQDKLKALQIVVNAREKNLKLLMDLGRIKKAAQEVTHKVEPSPFVQSWERGEAREKVKMLIEAQLDELPPPLPPSEDFDSLVNNEDEQDD